MEPTRLEIKNIPQETIVFGFTGPLGSGCTFFAKEIADQNNYLYVTLTDPINEEIKKQGLEGTPEDRQNIGNFLRRKNQDPGYLVRAVVEKANEDSGWRAEPAKRWKGLVLDGIRNTGEVYYLRQFRYSLLIAVHANSDKRRSRLKANDKIKSDEQFKSVDERDSEERGLYGQQVEKCTYLADVIINNEQDIPKAAEDKKASHVRDYMNRYVSLMTGLIQDKLIYEYSPLVHEACMTMAYCVSKRSLCLKRKVGAVIATEDGELLSSGYNHVPESIKDCVLDIDLEQCARDKLQQRFAEGLKYCPFCGTQLPSIFKCSNCERELGRYYKICPFCRKEADIAFTCEKCKTPVFEDYLPGGKPELGKLLDVCRSLHAEEMAIINLAKGTKAITKDAVLYTTTFPCNLCANKIVAVGINKVVFAEAYPMKEAIAILKGKVETQKFEGVKSSAFFHLYR